MANNTIKFNEAQLRNIVKESIKNVIKEHEEYDNPKPQQLVTDIYNFYNNRQ